MIQLIPTRETLKLCFRVYSPSFHSNDIVQIKYFFKYSPTQQLVYWPSVLGEHYSQVLRAN